MYAGLGRGREPLTLMLVLAILAIGAGQQPGAFQQYDVRLVGGKSSSSGRLEVYYNGTYGTVCGDGWTPDNTRVVCQQLGYNGGTAYTAGGGSGSSGPIHMDGVRCNATQHAYLHLCVFGGWDSSNCSHTEDIGLECSGLVTLRQPSIPTLPPSPPTPRPPPLPPPSPPTPPAAPSTTPPPRTPPTVSTPPTPPRPILERPPASHSCQVLLGGDIGGNGSEVVSLACNALSGSSMSHVRVLLGAALAQRFADSSWSASANGVEVVVANRSTSGANDANNTNSANSISANSSASGVDDWGVTFLDVPHLELVDSVVSDLPLSSVAAMLHFSNCSYVTLQNVTFQRLTGEAVTNSSQPPTRPVFGAVQADSIRSFRGLSVKCSQVHDSQGWSCISIQLDPHAQPLRAASVEVYDSFFLNNSVVSAGPYPSRAPGCSAGYGAVVVAFDDTTNATTGDDVNFTPSSIRLERSAFSSNTGGCGTALAVIITTPVYIQLVGTRVTANTALLLGGAIYAAGNISILSLLDQSLITGCRASRGGAIYTADAMGDVLISNSSTVSYNAANSSCGAIWARVSIGSLTVTANSSISWNTAGEHGGAVCSVVRSVGNFTVSDGSSVDGNTAGQHGGAIYANTGLIYVIITVNSSMSGNRAIQGDGGAIAVLSAGITNLVVSYGSQFSRNSVSSGYGGGIYTEQGIATVTVTETSFINGNSATNGGVIFSASRVGDIAVSKNSGIQNNSASQYCGVIYAEFEIASILVVANSSVSWNRARDNCGAFGTARSSIDSLVIADSSSVDGNTAFGGAGAFFSITGMTNVTITNNSSLSGNFAIENGGAIAVHSGNIQNIIVSNNSRCSANNASFGNGGGVYVYGNISTIVVDGSSSVDNNYCKNSGGAIYARNGVANMLVTGTSSMIGNMASQNGGAIAVLSGSLGSLTVANGSHVSRNSAFVSDTTSDSSGNGGAVYVSGNISTIQLTDGSFMNGNMATQGGVIFSGGSVGGVVVRNSSGMNNNSASANCGALWARVSLGAFSVVSNSRVSWNAAGDNGGAVCAAIRTIGNLTIADSSAMDWNTAGENAGAVYSGMDVGSVTITDGSSMSGNTATRGNGGAIAVLSGNLGVLVVSTNSRFTANNATVGHGGGVYVTANITTIVLTGSSTMDANYCGLSGGAVYARNALGGVTVAYGSSMSHNTALGNGGAIVVASGSMQSLAVSNGSHVSSNNSTSGNGGSVYVYGNISAILLTGTSTMDANYCGESGGAICARAGMGNVMLTAGSRMAGNRAREDGGAIAAGFMLNFTIAVGAGMLSNRATRGGSVFSTTITNLVVDGSTLSANSAQEGGAIHAVILKAAVYSSQVSDNSAVLDAGAFYSSPTRNVTQSWSFADSLLAGNHAGRNGGVLFLSVLERNDGAPAVLSINFLNSSTSGNVAGALGGAVAVSQCALQLRGGSFYQNSAQSGGAVAAMNGAVLSVTGATFTSNTAQQLGAALVAVSSASLTLDQCLLSFNTAMIGGAVAGDGCRKLAIRSSTIANSTATSDGGGISSHGCELTDIVSSEVRGNRANRGGGVHLQQAADEQAVAKVLVLDTTIASNHATGGYGGGMLVDARGVEVLVVRSLLFNNQASEGANIASFQDCQHVNGSSSLAGERLSVGIRDPLLASLAGWDHRQVTTPAAAGCSLFMLAGTAWSDSSSQQDITQDRRVATRVWFKDPALTALRLPCINDTSAAGSTESAAAAAAADGPYTEEFCAVKPGPALGWLEWPPARAMPVYPTLNCSAGSTSCTISATTGRAASFSLQLLDQYDRTVTSDTSAYTAQISVGARVTANTSCPTCIPAEQLVSVNVKVISFDAGGVARIPQFVIRGWPGEYDILVEVTGPHKVPVLILPVRLAGCQVGEALDYSLSLGTSSFAATECITCPRRQVGLLPDPRPPLDQTTNSTELQRHALVASGMCAPCPSTGMAVCVGGPVIVPRPGYWHSAPNSLLVHRCPNRDACSSDPPVPNSSSVANGSISATSAVLELLGAGDDRTLWLVMCQQQAYSTTTAGNNGSSDIPCKLSGVARDDPHAYLQQQCAEGYTGNLCAACQPGFNVNADFECTECSSVARTVGLGLLALFASVALILYGVVTNYGAAEDPTTGPAAGDILKVLVVHMQYFIIIARLNIPKPGVMYSFSGILAAVIGAENYFAYSHACLLPGQDSAGQAHLQLLGALLTPCAVTAVCMLIWVIRYYTFNRAVLRRSNATSRRADYTVQVSLGNPFGDAAGGDSSGGLMKSPRSRQSSSDEKSRSQSQKRSSRFKVGDFLGTLRSLRSPASGSLAGLVHADQTLSLQSQLGIVMAVSIFILFPSWAQAAFSVFSCYTIDQPSALNNESLVPFLQATHHNGYWVRNMNQACYEGSHASVYLPIGVVSLLIFCVAPPLISFILMWRVRHSLNDYHTRQVYGVMYSRYRPRYFWWDSAIMLQTLSLVAVDVFGRAILFQYQALMLLAVLSVIAGINSIVEPVRSKLLRHLEFASSLVLTLTITLSLYFAVGDGAALVDGPEGEAIAILIICINVAMLVTFLALILHRSWPAVKGWLGKLQWRAFFASCCCCWCCHKQQAGPTPHASKSPSMLRDNTDAVSFGDGTAGPVLSAVALVALDVHDDASAAVSLGGDSTDGPAPVALEVHQGSALSSRQGSMRPISSPARSSSDANNMLSDASAAV